MSESLRGGDLLAYRYRLLERTGAGGMSVIWRARDEALERVVAIKVLDAALAADRVHRELVRKEARAAARLSHPDATAVYDYGEAVTPEGHLVAYVVMQLLDGEPLAIRLAHGPLPWREAVRVAVRIARVLAAAHARGIVHRDITPDNVMLTPDGAKVLDFGIAARIGEPDDDATGWTFGTPPYVAPERLDGTPALAATDVYSLGALLFEMLTGRPPYPETTWAEIEVAQRDGPPPAPAVPGLPPRVARLCQECLATDPADRRSAADVADALSTVLAPEAPARSGRGRLVAAVAATALTAATVTVVFTTDPPSSIARLLNPTPGRTAEPPAPPVLGHPTPSAQPTRPPPSAADMSAPPSTPGAGPPSSPSTVEPVPTPPTFDEAFAYAHATLSEAIESGAVRPDAALDLRQVLDRIATDKANGVPGVDAQIADLSRKVSDRLREGAISRQAADELQAALTTLTSSLSRA